MNWHCWCGTWAGEECRIRWRRLEVDCTACEICSATVAFAVPPPPPADEPGAAILRQNEACPLVVVNSVGYFRLRSIFRPFIDLCYVFFNWSELPAVTSGEKIRKLKGLIYGDNYTDKQELIISTLCLHCYFYFW